MQKPGTLLAGGNACVINLQCATIFSDSKYDIQIKSTPPGATVLEQRGSNEIERMTTPGTYELDYGGSASANSNNRSHTLIVRKEGYNDGRIVIQRELDKIALIGVLYPVAVLIDWGTGSIWKPEQDEFSVELDPEQ